MGELAYHRLPAVMDVDMLDGHLLLAFAAVPVEGLHLCGECPHKLVRLIAGTVLLSNRIASLEALKDGNRR